MTLDEIRAEVMQWQAATFPGIGRASYVAHLVREAHELSMSLLGSEDEMREEIADVAILLFGIADLSGVDLAQAVAEKLAINKRRAWREPDAEGVIEHEEE